jgi:hypothetical protein
MTRFGGNEFNAFSMPLVFGGRYFVLEPGNPPLLSVFFEAEGRAVFEVLKNKPAANSLSDVSSTDVGIVAVSDKQTKRFLYKVRPGSETSVAFGKLDGGEVSVRITDRMILVGGNKFENCTFNGSGAGLLVSDNGDIRAGASLPQAVLRLLDPQS